MDDPPTQIQLDACLGRTAPTPEANAVLTPANLARLRLDAWHGFYIDGHLLWRGAALRCVARAWGLKYNHAGALLPVAVLRHRILAHLAAPARRNLLDVFVASPAEP